MPNHLKEHFFDVLIIGAGASGLFCALTAAQQGARVAVFDHNSRVGEKIRIAGGGKANFSNLHMDASHFIGANTDFCRSPLARYRPEHILDFLNAHGILWEEREHGQLFCLHSAQELVDSLVQDCHTAGCSFFLDTPVPCPQQHEGFFRVQLPNAQHCAPRLVLATGNIAAPQTGATDYSLRVAKDFGHRIQPPRPVLAPLMLDSTSPLLRLAGISLPVRIKVDGHVFLDPLLFTHKGISGPAVLQASCYWQFPQPLHIDFLPYTPLEQLWDAPEYRKSSVLPVLNRLLPTRLAQILVPPALASRKLAEISRKDRESLCATIHAHPLQPVGNGGMRKAEATAGGVDTRDISRHMESTLCPGLFIIGEALDITGNLGGYNLHWAWASGYAAGCRIAAARADHSQSQALS